jgi:hypothetical protein
MKKILFSTVSFATLLCSLGFSPEVEARSHRPQGYLEAGIEQRVPTPVVVEQRQPVFIEQRQPVVVERRVPVVVEQQRVAVPVRRVPVPVRAYREPVIVYEEPVREIVVVQPPPPPRPYFSFGWLFRL